MATSPYLVGTLLGLLIVALVSADVAPSQALWLVVVVWVGGAVLGLFVPGAPPARQLPRTPEPVPAAPAATASASSRPRRFYFIHEQRLEDPLHQLEHGRLVETRQTTDTHGQREAAAGLEIPAVRASWTETTAVGSGNETVRVPVLATRFNDLHDQLTTKDLLEVVVADAPLLTATDCHPGPCIHERLREDVYCEVRINGDETIVRCLQSTTFDSLKPIEVSTSQLHLVLSLAGGRRTGTTTVTRGFVNVMGQVTESRNLSQGLHVAIDVYAIYR